MSTDSLEKSGVQLKTINHFNRWRSDLILHAYWQEVIGKKLLTSKMSFNLFGTMRGNDFRWWAQNQILPTLNLFSGVFSKLVFSDRGLVISGQKLLACFKKKLVKLRVSRVQRQKFFEKSEHSEVFWAFIEICFICQPQIDSQQSTGVNLEKLSTGK